MRHDHDGHNQWAANWEEFGEALEGIIREHEDYEATKAAVGEPKEEPWVGTGWIVGALLVLAILAADMIGGFLWWGEKLRGLL